MLGVILAAGFAAQTIDGWTVTRTAERCEATRPVAGDPAGSVMLWARATSQIGTVVTITLRDAPVGWVDLPFDLYDGSGPILPGGLQTRSWGADGGLNLLEAFEGDQAKRLGAASSVDLGVEGAPRRRIMTGSLAGVTAALEQCRITVLREWGITPDRLMAVDPYVLVSYFSSDDYPTEARRRHKVGRVVYLVGVGADGSPESCKILVSSKTDSLDARTCEILMERGHFAAAPAGTPQRWVVGSTRWVLD